jgi:undecaprenyl-diphosphatase
VRTLRQRLLARIPRRDRGEVMVLAGAILLIVLALVFLKLASGVFAGETRTFDERMLRGLRHPDDPALPIGPRWLTNGALDMTALGDVAVLGLTVLAVVGYLFLHGLYRTGLFILAASVGGWVLQFLLKVVFDRPRPDVVPHLREVMSTSFPSGHALTSAAVYLTLGALTMRLAKGRVAKFYCLAIAMLVTFLVGSSRVYLGVHYPTDVLAGWIIGLSWALLCLIVETLIERRAGLKREQQRKAREQQET